MLDRLGVRREVRQTELPNKAYENLSQALDLGQTVLVWADAFSLKYTGLCTKAPMWFMKPILVVGQEGDDFLVVDCRADPIRVPKEELAHARGIVKKDRHMQMTIEAYDFTRESDAAITGIIDTINLFSGRPPLGAAHNFGLGAFDHWIEMLTNIRNKASWMRYFGTGPRLFQALAGRHGQPGIYGWVKYGGTDSGMDRGIYAEFLNDACKLLARPQLAEAAKLFQRSARLWDEFADAVLPPSVPELYDARATIDELNRIRRQAGIVDASLVEKWRAYGRDETMMTESEALQLFTELRDRLVAIRDVEKEAFEFLS